MSKEYKQLFEDSLGDYYSAKSNEDSNEFLIDEVEKNIGSFTKEQVERIFCVVMEQMVQDAFDEDEDNDKSPLDMPCPF